MPNPRKSLYAVQNVELINKLKRFREAIIQEYQLANQATNKWGAIKWFCQENGLDYDAFGRQLGGWDRSLHPEFVALMNQYIAGGADGILAE